jgi:hypothetical protein
MTKWGGHRVMSLRDQWATRLPQPCPRCNQDVQPWQRWDLGHVLPKHRYPWLMWEPGNLRPEHARCNRRDGAHTTNNRHRRAAQPAPNW